MRSCFTSLSYEGRGSSITDFKRPRVMVQLSQGYLSFFRFRLAHVARFSATVRYLMLRTLFLLQLAVRFLWLALPIIIARNIHSSAG